MYDQHMTILSQQLRLQEHINEFHEILLAYLPKPMAHR